MDFTGINTALLDFLDRSPVPFYAVRNMKESLEKEGFRELYEGEHWTLQEGDACYVCRNDSALIAFRIPKTDFTGFQIIASHCDSPMFRIKPNAEITAEGRYIKLNIEKYGGAVLAPWLDRPLSVAGRVIVETESGIETKLVNIDKDLLIIPNLAIHMNRQVNEGFKYNLQTDLLPLLGEIPGAGAGGAADLDTSCPAGRKNDSPGAGPEMEAAAAAFPQKMEKDPRGTGTGPGASAAGTQAGFLSLLAAEAGVRPEQILDTDLYLYSRMKGTYVGMNREFLCSGRLDDLQCAFASLQGILTARPRDSVAVHCVFDNEEVGSGTAQGAAGTFLRDVLRRINEGLGRSEEDYLRALPSSFMVSLDNAHAVHPNHPEKADPTNRPYMNGGIVIKYDAGKKYTTDAVSGAIFRSVCKKAGVPFQTFTNRSDMIGGSTLGHISQAQVSLNTVDAGLAQLAMHSPYETAGAKDTAWLVEAARVLFSSSVENTGSGKYRLHF